MHQADADTYTFTDTQGNIYTCSTGDFNSRMDDHITSGRLASGQ